MSGRTLLLAVLAAVAVAGVLILVPGPEARAGGTGSLSGRITAAEAGGSVAGTCVSVYADPGTGHWNSAWTSAGSTCAPTTTGSSWSWNASGLAPGEYRIFFGSGFDATNATRLPGWYGGGTGTSISVNGAVTGLNATLARGRTISGTITPLGGTEGEWVCAAVQQVSNTGGPPVGRQSCIEVQTSGPITYTLRGLATARYKAWFSVFGSTTIADVWWGGASIADADVIDLAVANATGVSASLGSGPFQGPAPTTTTTRRPPSTTTTTTTPLPPTTAAPAATTTTSTSTTTTSTSTTSTTTRPTTTTTRRATTTTTRRATTTTTRRRATTTTTRRRATTTTTRRPTTTTTRPLIFLERDSAGTEVPALKSRW